MNEANISHPTNAIMHACTQHHTHVYIHSPIFTFGTADQKQTTSKVRRRIVPAADQHSNTSSNADESMCVVLFVSLLIEY